jgi:hypothetical protein
VESLFSRFEQTSHRAGGFYVKKQQKPLWQSWRGALGWSLSSAGLNKQVTVQEDSTSKTAKTTLAKLEKQEYFGRSESGRAARTPVEKARRRGARPTANRCDVILVVVPYRARGNFGD